MHNVIECQGIGKKFGRIWGVEEVSFTAMKGSVTVLAGPNGAGKTTTVRVLTTVYKPDKGSARVAGYDVIREYREVRKRISYQPQTYGMSPDMTPEEMIVDNLMLHGYSYWDARREARKWLEELGLYHVRDRRGWVLSGGERRRTIVAAILAVPAEIYFLDEPTSGVDVEGRYEILKIIRRVVNEGSTILMTTHDMREAQMIADKVVFISKGKTIASGKPAELIESLPYKYKAIIRKSPDLRLTGYRYVDVGDKAIVYGETRSEIIGLVEELGVTTYDLREADLEDVYLNLVRGRD